MNERAKDCMCSGGGRKPRGEEGELKQLAALSRTHQGEIEGEGEKRGGLWKRTRRKERKEGRRLMKRGNGSV